jgi:ATP-dependent protease ClpP protease subunit
MDILSGEIGYEITVKDLQNKKSVVFNSPGGSLYEGLAMYDYAKANQMDVGVIGLCASACTLPLIASPTRWGTPNSTYLIHNPAQSYFFASLTAEEMQRGADELQKEQDRALNLYLSVLTGTKEEIQAIMDSEKMLNAQEALALGLITEIKDIPQEVTPEQKQEINSLYNKYTMKLNKMENTEIKKEISGLRLLFEDIKSLIMKSKSPVNMLVLQDVNGVELDFGAAIQTPEEVIVGVSATVAGAPAVGEYTMPSGEVYVFEAGVLTAINQPVNADNAALKAENEDLKAEVALLREDNEMKTNLYKEIELKLKDFSLKFEAIQKKLPEEKQTPNVPPKVESKKEHGFTWTFKN